MADASGRLLGGVDADGYWSELLQHHDGLRRAKSI